MTTTPDLKAAIERFKADTSAAELFEPMRPEGATNGGEFSRDCPKCAAGNDRLRVWPNRTDGPVAWCRQCEVSGDVLDWAMILDGRDPSEKGARPKYLTERGYLGDSAQSNGSRGKTPSTRRVTKPANNRHRTPAPAKSKREYPTIAAAVSAIQTGIERDTKRKPQPSKVTPWPAWEYQDTAGAVVMCVVRFDLEFRNADGANTPRSKEYRPLHRTAGGKWCIGDPPGLLPLFRLPRIIANRAADAAMRCTVFVTEGEKKVEVGERLGLLCTTSSHGAKTPQKTDWTPLAGQSAVILPDNDEPGRQYARHVADTLLRLDPPASVKIVALPGLAEGDDIFDFAKARGEAAKAEVKAAGRKWTEADGDALAAKLSAEVVALAESAELVKLSETAADTSDTSGGARDEKCFRGSGSDDHEPFGNAVCIGFTERGTPRMRAMPLKIIAHDLRKRLSHQFIRIGAELFATTADAEGLPAPIADTDSLFANIQAVLGPISWGQGGDEKGRTLVTKREFYAHLFDTAAAYAELATAPHWPMCAESYYAHPKLPAATGKALSGLMAFYQPASAADAALLRAFARTLAWGGPCGQRPIFAVLSDGLQGSGKTKLVETWASLVGGVHKIQPGQKRESLAGQILSRVGRRHRVLLLDNVTGAARSAEIADLVTAQSVMGESKYLAVGEMPNRFTLAITTNALNLSTDLADRTFVMRILPADTTARPNWLAEVTAFIDAKRWQILADIVDELRNDSAAVAITQHPSRFSMWTHNVLNRGPLANQTDAVLSRRSAEAKAHDGENDDLGAFVTLMAAIAAGSTERPELPTREAMRIGLRPEQVAAVWNAATGRRDSTTDVTRENVAPAMGKGKLPWLEKKHLRNGTIYRVTFERLEAAVTDVTDGDGLTSDIRHVGTRNLNSLPRHVTDVTDEIRQTHDARTRTHAHTHTEGMSTPLTSITKPSEPSKTQGPSVKDASITDSDSEVV